MDNKIAFIPEDEATLVALARECEDINIPTCEPGNFGPDDNTFNDFLSAAAKMPPSDMFPPATLTAYSQYPVKD